MTSKSKWVVEPDQDDVTCKQWIQILGRARLDLPCEKHLYRQEIADQTPGKGEFEAMPRSAISCSFTPSISLHATLDHILLVESFEHFHDLQLAISVVSFNLRIGCHPGEYPRKSSSKKDQPVLILFVCFLQLIGDLCRTIDNAMIITGIVFPPTSSPLI